MAKLKVETGKENKVLREKSKVVKTIDRALLKIIKDMEETMEAESGCGLAAPQIGRNIRLIVVKLNQSTEQEVNLAMINPEIIFRSEETYIDTEGCLSLPEYFDEVERAMDIIVKFKDTKSREKTLKLSELNARVIQHEIDHLDGILFADKAIGGMPESLMMEIKKEKQLKL